MSEIKNKSTLFYQIAPNKNDMPFNSFLIWPILEAGTEMGKFFRSFLKELKGRKNCFWDFSTLSALQKCDHANTVVHTAQHTHFYTFIQYYVL